MRPGPGICPGLVDGRGIRVGVRVGVRTSCGSNGANGIQKGTGEPVGVGVGAGIGVGVGQLVGKGVGFGVGCGYGDGAGVGVGVGVGCSRSPGTGCGPTVGGLSRSGAIGGERTMRGRFAGPRGSGCGSASGHAITSSSAVSLGSRIQPTGPNTRASTRGSARGMRTGCGTRTGGGAGGAGTLGIGPRTSSMHASSCPPRARHSVTHSSSVSHSHPRGADQLRGRRSYRLRVRGPFDPQKIEPGTNGLVGVGSAIGAFDPGGGALPTGASGELGIWFSVPELVGRGRRGNSRDGGELVPQMIQLSSPESDPEPCSSRPSVIHLIVGTEPIGAFASDEVPPFDAWPLPIP